MEDPNDASSSQTETSVDEDIRCSGSKDTQKPNHHETDTLQSQAIEVNSADDIRKAIKAVMSGKTPKIRSEETDPIKPSNTESEEIQVSIPNGYKPESGDQLLVPKQDKSRKRRGRPQKAGPSKRVKKATVEDFYVGKLSNVVRFPSYNHQRNESDSDGSMFMPAPYALNQWVRMRFYK